MKKTDINRVLNLVEEFEESSVRFLQDMIKAKSENPPGEYKEIAGVVRQEMENLGIETNIVEFSPLADFETLLSMEEITPEVRGWIEKGNLPPELQPNMNQIPNVVGRIRGSTKGPTLIFNAHMDTVPEGGGWSVSPFEGIVKDGKIFGRGASDNKGGIAIALTAARAIKDSGVELKGDIVLAFTAEEEVGGHTGAAFLIERGIVRGDACLCTDGPADSIISSFNGYVPFIVTTTGKTVHGAYPSQGINAISKMTKIQNVFARVEESLRNEKSRYPSPPDTPEEYTSIVPTTINGGTRFYIVPDKCTSWIDVHVIPDQDPNEIRKLIEDEIRKEQEKDPELQVDIRVPVVAKPAIVDPSAMIVGKIQSAAKQVLGNELPMRRMSSLTDARFFLAAGIPTLTYGPFGVGFGCHAADEWVKIRDLTTISKVYALTALNYLG
jgi:succinyl-diaminopimelate desuccinylase